MAQRSHKEEWSRFLGDKTLLFWFALWVVASLMLWKKFSDRSPWPISAIMPF